MSNEADFIICWGIIGAIVATVFVRTMNVGKDSDDPFIAGLTWMILLVMWPCVLVAVLFTYACLLIGSVLRAPRG